MSSNNYIFGIVSGVFVLIIFIGLRFNLFNFLVELVNEFILFGVVVSGVLVLKLVGFRINLFNFLVELVIDMFIFIFGVFVNSVFVVGFIC